MNQTTYVIRVAIPGNEQTLCRVEVAADGAYAVDPSVQGEIVVHSVRAQPDAAPGWAVERERPVMVPADRKLLLGHAIVGQMAMVLKNGVSAESLLPEVNVFPLGMPQRGPCCLLWALSQQSPASDGAGVGVDFTEDDLPKVSWQGAWSVEIHYFPAFCRQFLRSRPGGHYQLDSVHASGVVTSYRALLPPSPTNATGFPAAAVYSVARPSADWTTGTVVVGAVGDKAVNEFGHRSGRLLVASSAPVDLGPFVTKAT